MAKNGITDPKKDWKEWKDPFQERKNPKKNWKEKDLFKRGRVSFRSCSNKFRPMHISAPNPILVLEAIHYTCKIGGNTDGFKDVSGWFEDGNCTAS